MGRAVQPSRSPGAHVERGAFTFVEILATMAMMAIVLPAVMNGMSLCLSTADVARQQSQASSLGHSKLMDMVAAGQWQHADLAGDFGDDWPNYRWAAEVSDWDEVSLRQVDVTVWWRLRGTDRSVTLSTLVYTGGAQ